eukprot:2800180-Prymnesium_polylepis.1
MPAHVGDELREHGRVGLSQHRLRPAVRKVICGGALPVSVRASACASFECASRTMAQAAAASLLPSRDRRAAPPTD